MKLALVQLTSEFSKSTPLGIAYLASYARKYGNFNNIVIINRENPIKNIKRERPDIVGVSSSIRTYPMAELVAKKIKEEMNIPTIIGGNHITTLPEAFYKSNFDIAVLGEGEQTMLELLQSYEKFGGFQKDKLKDIRGIMYKDGNNIKVTEKRPMIENLDTIPFPARDLFDMKYYLQPWRGAFSDKLRRILPIITTRGCPYNCTFCPVSSLWGKPRFHSAEYVVNEIKHLYEKYKIDGIRIWDDTFTTNINRLREIVRLIKEEKINEKIEFYVYGRTNLINSEMINLLKQMNVAYISFGLESGSERILKYLKKGNVTVADNRRAIRLCKEAGITTEGFFIIGSPGETEEDLKQTMEMVKDKDIDDACVYQLTPYPATDLWKQLEKEGQISKNTQIPSPEFYNPELVLTKEMTKEKFKEWYDKFQQVCQSKYFGKPLNFQLNLKYLLSPKFVFRMLVRWEQLLNYLKFNYPFLTRRKSD